MKPLNTFVSAILLSMLFSCENNSSLAPENNSFSYLDSVSNKNDSEKSAPVVPNKLNISELICQKVHKELIGSIISKNINSPSVQQPDYRKSYVLSLNTPFTLECSNEQQINTAEVVLNINPDINIEQYLGSTVLAIGEVSKSAENNPGFPLEMSVIRIEAIKGSLK